MFPFPATFDNSRIRKRQFNLIKNNKNSKYDSTTQPCIPPVGNAYIKPILSQNILLWRRNLLLVTIFLRAPSWTSSFPHIYIYVCVCVCVCACIIQTQTKRNLQTSSKPLPQGQKLYENFHNFSQFSGFVFQSRKPNGERVSMLAMPTLYIN